MSRGTFLCRRWMRTIGATFFNQSFMIKGDRIPEASAEKIIDELRDLFVRHNVWAALSARAVSKPTKEFHAVRHTLYSEEVNVEIDRVVSGAASVKTKFGEIEGCDARLAFADPFPMAWVCFDRKLYLQSWSRISIACVPVRAASKKGLSRVFPSILKLTTRVPCPRILTLRTEWR